MAEFHTAEVPSLNPYLITDDDQITIVEAMGDIARSGIAEEWANTISDRTTVHVKDHIKRTKGKVQKHCGQCYVTVSGTQHGVRNAEVAFINEFGCDSKKIKASHHFLDGVQKNQEKIYAAGEEAYNKIVEERGNK